jgi:hypothetical protein
MRIRFVFSTVVAQRAWGRSGVNFSTSVRHRVDGRVSDMLLGTTAASLLRVAQKRTCDVWKESLEQRGALCFPDECSGIVRISEGYDQFLGEAKPGLSEHNTRTEG